MSTLCRYSLAVIALFLLGGTTIRSQTAAAKPKNETAVTKQSPSEAAAKYFPNTLLLTQQNKQVHFFDDLLNGNVVLINFMFTTCTSICPPMTANLAKVQQLLGERVGKEVTMISISVDPVTDTPERLKAYAAKFGAKPGWYFLTGEKKDVDEVLRKLGGYVDNKNDHTSILIAGNTKTGEWLKIYALARPSDIAAAVTKLIGTE
jgi:protein SCO1/2